MEMLSSLDLVSAVVTGLVITGILMVHAKTANGSRGPFGALYWMTLGGAFVLAIFCYLLARTPWNLTSSFPVLDPIFDGPATRRLFWAATMSWCVVVGVAFWRWRLEAWPALLGAPFALSLPNEIAFLLGACVFGHACI
jgi:hypothetical protein